MELAGLRPLPLRCSERMKFLAAWGNEMDAQMIAGKLMQSNLPLTEMISHAAQIPSPQANDANDRHLSEKFGSGRDDQV
jgi:hypothetical protein